MTRTKESQIKTIRFDVDRLVNQTKEDLTVEEVRQAAIEIASRVAYELVMLGAEDDR